MSPKEMIKNIEDHGICEKWHSTRTEDRSHNLWFQSRSDILFHDQGFQPMLIIISQMTIRDYQLNVYQWVDHLMQKWTEGSPYTPRIYCKMMSRAAQPNTVPISIGKRNVLISNCHIEVYYFFEQSCQFQFSNCNSRRMKSVF